MSVTSINFSDFVAALALIVSLAAFYVALSSAKIEEKRFLGDSEIVINSNYKDGKILVGDSAQNTSIAEISIYLPDAIEPLKTYTVRAGEPWINSKAEKYIRDYFEWSVDRFLEAMINGWEAGFEDFYADRPLKIEVPFETVIGVYVKSRSLGDDQKMYASYKIKAIHKIDRSSGVYTKLRRPVAPKRRGLTGDQTEFKSVRFLRKIELPEEKVVLTTLLKEDMVIPDSNNFRQLEFYVGRELFPAGYSKDD